MKNSSMPWCSHIHHGMGLLVFLGWYAVSFDFKIWCVLWQKRSILFSYEMFLVWHLGNETPFFITHQLGQKQLILFCTKWQLFNYWWISAGVMIFFFTSLSSRAWSFFPCVISYYYTIYGHCVIIYGLISLHVWTEWIATNIWWEFHANTTFRNIFI